MNGFRESSYNRKKKVQVLVSRVWLFVTPQTVTHQAPLSTGFSRQEYWSELPFPSPGDLSNSGIKPMSSVALALQADSSPVESVVSVQFSSVQSLSHVRLFATPWIAAHQASLSITNSPSSFKFKSIKSVMPFSHLILCCPLLLLPPIHAHIRIFFQWVNSLHEVAKVLEFQLQYQSFQWTPRTDLP